MSIRRIVLSIMLLIAFLCVAGCSTFPPRLQESGLNSRFAFDDATPFDEYIRKTEQMIKTARVDIHKSNEADIMNANLPFELRPDESRYARNASGRHEKGILLIHGLSDSPYFMRAVARYFQDKGFLVQSILLPGHGTVPGDLLRVTHQEWVRAAEYGVHRLKTHVHHLYIGGFSTGGALCILEALRDPEIKGLILFAPAVGIKNPWAAAADFMKSFNEWFGDHRDDVDYAKYESFTVNAGAQVYHLTQEIDAAFASGKHLAVPVFMVLSADDISVDSKKAVTIFRTRMTSVKSVLMLYGKSDKTSGKDEDSRIIFANSYFPEERIADFAHICLLIPPNDRHYGKNGDYRSCLHYQGDKEKRRSCLHDPNVWQGELTKENLKARTMRRLTYNPCYDEMIKTLDHFLSVLNNAGT